MIYFAQPVEGGPIKIGYSENVPARMRQLESHYGKPLVLLATIPGNELREREIHEQFEHLRFGRTEQFQPAPDLMVFIDRPLFINAMPVEEMPVADPDMTLIAVKCRPAYKQWLIKFAGKKRLSVPTLIDYALVAMARDTGIEDPPERI